uniref:CD48 antigen-like n=1 Tax=Stegastes partitus TaxID=144197 RepID=A0A3B4ZB25_9TELE
MFYPHLQSFSVKSVCCCCCCLSVIFPDNTVINVNVLDGNNVTLDPGIKELQKHHTVKWTKGRDFVGTLIAQWKDFKTFINETFKDVLQLNEHTGALTFTSVTRDLAGLNVLPVIHTNASITYQLANDGICYAICSVRNAPEVTLSWYKEEKKLNESRDPDISVNLTLPLQIQSQPEGIYICRAANPVSEETASLNSTQWCPPHRSGTLQIHELCRLKKLVRIFYRYREIYRNRKSSTRIYFQIISRMVFFF